jgi:hypothetical protein
VTAVAVDVAGDQARMAELAAEITSLTGDIAQLDSHENRSSARLEGLDAVVALQNKLSHRRVRLAEAQRDFDELRRAAGAREEERRAALASAREAARPQLLARRDELEADHRRGLAAVEEHLAALRTALEEALAPIPELNALGDELEERRGYTTEPWIAIRIKYVLVRLGPMRDLDPILGGTGGREPLVEPEDVPAATAQPNTGAGRRARGASGRSGASSTDAGSPPLAGKSLPGSSTGRARSRPATRSSNRRSREPGTKT